MGCCVSSIFVSHNRKPRNQHSSTHLENPEDEECILIKEVVPSETLNISKSQLLLPESPQLAKSLVPTNPESLIELKKLKTSENYEDNVEINVSRSGVSDFASFGGSRDAVLTSTGTTPTLWTREKIEEEEEATEAVSPPKTEYPTEFAGPGTGGGNDRVRPPQRRRSSISPARDHMEPTRFRRFSDVDNRRRSRLLGTGNVGGGVRSSVGKGVTMRTGGSSCRSTDGIENENSRSVVDGRNDSVSGSISESFENPLVSLECFIFL